MFQTGEVQKAANAAFTVLQQQPNNEVMRENFKYYTTMEGVDTASIVSLEPQVRDGGQCSAPVIASVLRRYCLLSAGRTGGCSRCSWRGMQALPQSGRG